MTEDEVRCLSVLDKLWIKVFNKSAAVSGLASSALLETESNHEASVWVRDGMGNEVSVAVRTGADQLIVVVTTGGRVSLEQA